MELKYTPPKFETKVVQVQNEKYTLELTREEVTTLRILGYRVGGSPEKSRRKHVDSLNRAIDEAAPHIAEAIVERQTEWSITDHFFVHGGVAYLFFKSEDGI